MTHQNEQAGSATLLTEAQAAEMLQVQTKTVGDWGRSGKLKRIVLSPRCIRYRASDVQALIDGAEETEAQNN